MRKGFNGLYAAVSERLGEDPRSGALFVKVKGSPIKAVGQQKKCCPHPFFPGLSSAVERRLPGF
jgi:hypothetical protein